MEKTFEGFWNNRNSDLEIRRYYGATIINTQDNHRNNLNECVDIIKKNKNSLNKYTEISHQARMQYIYLYGFGYTKMAFLMNPNIHIVLMDKEKKIFKEHEKFTTYIQFETFEKCFEFLEKCGIEPPYRKEFDYVMLWGFKYPERIDHVLKWRSDHLEFYEYYKKQTPEYKPIFDKIDKEIKRKREENKEWDPFGEEN